MGRVLFTINRFTSVFAVGVVRYWVVLERFFLRFVRGFDVSVEWRGKVDGVSAILLVVKGGAVVSGYVSLPTVGATVFRDLDRNVEGVVLPAFAREVMVVLRQLVVGEMDRSLAVLAVAADLVVVSMLDV